MRRILKYPLTTRPGLQEIRLRRKSDLLHVGNQNDAPFLWASVDDQLPECVVELYCFHTGDAVPDNIQLRHVGTVLLYGGSMVLHFYLRF